MPLLVILRETKDLSPAPKGYGMYPVNEKPQERSIDYPEVYSQQ